MAYPSENTYEESGGLVCLVCENATRVVDGPVNSFARTANAGAISGYLVLGTPSSGRFYSSSDGDAPYIEWDIYFSTGGTYYLGWRGNAPSATNDSYHVRMDEGSYTSINFSVAPSTSTVGWYKYGASNLPTVSFTVTAGIHTFRMQEREAGQSVDRFVLSTDSSYDPGAVNGGDGPAESTVLSGGATGAAVQYYRRIIGV